MPPEERKRFISAALATQPGGVTAASPSRPGLQLEVGMTNPLRSGHRIPRAPFSCCPLSSAVVQPPGFSSQRGLNPTEAPRSLAKPRGRSASAGRFWVPALLNGHSTASTPDASVGVTGSEGSQAPTNHPGMREERDGAAAGSATSSSLPGRGLPDPEQSWPQRLFLLPNQQHTQFLRRP